MPSDVQPLPQIEVPVFSLRNFEMADSQALVKILNDEQVVKFLSTKIPYPYTQEDAQWWIKDGSQTGLIKAITIKNELIGCIGVSRGEFEYQRSGELGYWLAPQYWRQGITKVAIERLCHELFSTTDIERVFACVFNENIASQRLLLKAGFEREAILRKAIFKNNKFYDNVIFAKLKS
ncbi:GNAT family N-acetyltransferase [Thalassotalea ganghwensis]